MPTLPRFDPANLPPYPEKPHKTGQARVNVDGKSQYLGKYGTVESHALYHLACARKLITGVVPTTRDLRNELSAVAENNDSRGTFAPSLLTVVALVLLVAITSGTLSHYLTKATVRNAPSEQIVTHKPVLEESEVGRNAADGDNQPPALKDTTSEIVRETMAAFPNASLSDALDFAAERVKTFPERSQENGKEVDSLDEG